MDMVGGIPTPLKNMKVNWDDYSQYHWIIIDESTFADEIIG